MIDIIGRLISGSWKYNSFGKKSVVWPFKLRGRYSKCVSIGDHTCVLPFSRIQCFPEKDKNPRVIIGNNSMLGYCTTILCAGNAEVKIGNWVLMASHILITAENHGMNPNSDLYYIQQPLDGKSVVIGDGCWIGEKVVILPGVTIGEKSVIGAGSVVTKDIPSYAIAVGNPARVIKIYDFEEKIWKSV